MNQLGVRIKIHDIEIRTKEASLKTNMVEPAWVIYTKLCEAY